MEKINEFDEHYEHLKEKVLNEYLLKYGDHDKDNINEWLKELSKFKYEWKFKDNTTINN